ncbi:MAG: M28 family peptidase [Pirellulaceae bacterium]
MISNSLLLRPGLAISVCLLYHWLATVAVNAQESPLVDLSANEYEALQQISDASVSGTISFLASDELAGRGTPSKELNIAAAYVASRLRAAGAEGLGPNGSYYIESSLETVQTASSGCRVVVKSRPTGDQADAVVQSSLIAGTEDVAMTYSGKVLKVHDTEPPESVAGPVVIQLGDDEGDGPPPMFQIRQAARRLSAVGATVLLVEVPATTDDSTSHPLWAIAKQMQDAPRTTGARSQFNLPVVLVAANQIKDGATIELTVPADLKGSTVVRNVAGVVRGSDEKLAQQALLFSAHLDHLGSGAPGADPIYNGADDDASGVTAVLTLADAFASLQPVAARSTIFVTFWGEEQGLLGSKEFVQNSPWPLDQVVANINIEMVGRPEANAENKMWMTGWTESSLGQQVAFGSRRVGVETFEHPRFSAMLYRASDNFSFVQQGVIAHSFSAGSLHDDYHQPGDEWQKLNLTHMTNVIRGLFAGTLPIAHGKVTPVVRSKE